MSEKEDREGEEKSCTECRRREREKFEKNGEKRDFFRLRKDYRCLETLVNFWKKRGKSGVK
jgi:hypothetical protein